MNAIVSKIKRYPATACIFLYNIALIVLSIITPNTIVPLSAYGLFLRGNIISIITYPGAYFRIGTIVITIQMVSEILALLLIGHRSEDIYGSIRTSTVFFSSNIIGGVFSCYLNLISITQTRSIIYITYVGNYPGIMALLFLYSLHRPNHKEWLPLFLPYGIIVPCKVRRMGIIMYNFGVAVSSFCFYAMPFNHICFSSLLVVYPYAYILYLVCLRGSVDSRQAEHNLWYYGLTKVV